MVSQKALLVDKIVKKGGVIEKHTYKRGDGKRGHAVKSIRSRKEAAVAAESRLNDNSLNDLIKLLRHPGGPEISP